MADVGILNNEEIGEEEDVEMTAAEVLDKLEEVRSCGINVCVCVRATVSDSVYTCVNCKHGA